MQELAAERRVVKAELDKLKVDAWVFEDDAGARPQSVQATYLKEVEAADLYIGIFWRGYGDYTVEEYKHAWKLGKPCFIYEKRTAIKDHRDPKLQVFLDEIGKVKGDVTIRRFNTTGELGRYVKDDLARWQAATIRERIVPRFAPPVQAPPLSDQYVERTALLTSIKEALLPIDTKDTLPVTRSAFHGIGGAGKSVMAAAFAHNEVVQQQFPDGILWVTLGQSPDLAQRLSDLGRGLHDPQIPDSGYPNIQTAVSQLRMLLKSKACLLIVDDAWESEHVKQGFLVGGPQCLLLVTTRKHEIAEEIGAKIIEIEEMSQQEAIVLMANWAGEIAREDLVVAVKLAKAVGHLPLALELVATQVNKLKSWSDYFQLWKEKKLEALKRGRRAKGKEDSVRDSFELSLYGLSKKDQEYYLQLAVFRQKAYFPANACAALWGCSKAQALEVLVDFAGQALLKRSSLQLSFFTFHDLLHQFVADLLGPNGIAAAHASLLDGYRRQCAEGWETGPKDGYFFEHLTHHMICATRYGELHQLLTASPNWMLIKRQATYSDASFGIDVDLALQQYPNPICATDILRVVQLHAAKRAVRTRSDNIPSSILKALRILGREMEALSLARDQSSPEKVVEGLLSLSKVSFWRKEASSLIDEACEVAERIVDPAEAAPALSHIGLAYASIDQREKSAQNFKRAEVLAKRVDNEYSVNELLLNLAHGMVRAKQFGEVGRVLEAIDVDKLSEEGVATLVSVLVTIGRKKEAKAKVMKVLALETSQLGTMFAALAYAGLGLGFMRIGASDKSQEAFREAIRLCEQGSSAEDLERRRDSVRLQVVRALVEANKLHLAFDLAVLIENVFDRIEALCEIAHSEGIGETVGLIPSLLAELSQLSGKKGGRETVATYMTGIHLAYRAQIAAVLVRAEAGDRENVSKEVDRILLELGSDGPKSMLAIAFVKIASSLFTLGYRERADEVLIYAMTLADAVGHPIGQYEVWGQIATALFENGRISEAKEILNVLESSLCELDTASAISSWRRLAKVKIRSGDLSDWADVFLEANDKLNEPVVHKFLPADVLAELVRVLVERKDIVGAERIVQRLRTIVNNRASEVQRPLCIALGLIGSTEEAINIADQLPNEERAEVLLGIIASSIGTATEQELEHLMELACRDPEENPRLLVKLAEVEFRRGRLLEALNHLERTDWQTFLENISAWAPSMEEYERGLGMEVMKAVLRIFGWISLEVRELTFDILDKLDKNERTEYETNRFLSRRSIGVRMGDEDENEGHCGSYGLTIRCT